MARKKSQTLKDTSVHIMRALKESEDIQGSDFIIEDGGVVSFKHVSGKMCRIKATFVTGPREKNSTIDELI